MAFTPQRSSTREILIECGDVVLRAGLFDTPTAARIWAALPVTGALGRWGGEIFVPVPLDIAVERAARQIVEPGALGFWCEGRNVCIAVGPTPISLANECRLVAPVNVWGRLLDDGEPLRDLREGEPMCMRRGEPCSS